MWQASLPVGIALPTLNEACLWSMTYVGRTRSASPQVGIAPWACSSLHTHNLSGLDRYLSLFWFPKPERSPGSVHRLRGGGRHPLLSEGGLCCDGEEELSGNGWVLESVKLTGRQLFTSSYTNAACFMGRYVSLFRFPKRFGGERQYYLVQLQVRFNFSLLRYYTRA